MATSKGARRNGADPSAKGAPRPTQEERAAESKRRLIATTIDILASDGYRAATTDRIQKESGLSRGLVGYHFGSKYTLMNEVVSTIKADFIRETEPADQHQLTGMEQMENRFGKYLARLEERPERARAVIILAAESISGPPELRESLAAYLDSLRSRYADMIRTGQQDGSITTTGDPDRLAGVLEGLLRGIVLQYLVAGSSFDLSGVRASAMDVLRTCLGSPSK